MTAEKGKPSSFLENKGVSEASASRTAEAIL